MHELDSSAVKLLEGIVSEFSDRCGRGENPDVDEYVAQHPQLEDQLRDVLSAIKMLRDLTPGEPRRRRAPLAVNLPEAVGDYRIVREIGRGGMGVVYHAVQQSLGRPVALKVLPQSLLSDETNRERFFREAAIAAQLHHTNIVPVFGTGSAGDLHYYAMQLIEGESLDGVIAELRESEPLLDAAFRWKSRPPADGDRFAAAARRLVAGRLAESEGDCAAHSSAAIHPDPMPSTSFRSGGGSSPAATRAGYCTCVARIGMQAAAALAHSHAQGILHRDIKPSNLILDHAGTIWVADFGLARQDDQSGLTSAGDVVGTLRYLAPERFRGSIDARADVYSLGLTLYELLTFRSPFKGPDRQRLVRQILETDPPPPRKLRAGVPRDLETIILKAIAKEPEHRYPSAAALGSDLQRYLDGRPVTARPLGPAARTWRWCRRNPAVASLASALFVVLLTGLAIVTGQWRRAESNLALAVQSQREAAANLDEARRQRDRAERNFLRARQAVDDYLTTISESELLDVPTLEPLRAELLSRAQEFYELFLKTRGDEPQLNAELAATYIRLSQVAHDLGGDWLPFYEAGVTILEQLASHGAEFTEFRSWREGVNASRAGWLNTDRPEQVLPLTERGISIWRRLAEKHPTVQGFRSDLANLLQLRGMIHLGEKRVQSALDDFKESRTLRESLVEENPEMDKFRYGLAESYTMIGIVHLQQDALDEALRCTTRARNLFDELSRGKASATRLAGLQAALLQWIAAIRLRQGRPLEALADFRGSILLQERLAREYPYVPRFQTDLAASYVRLGSSLFDAGQDDAAIATFVQCFELLRQRIADYPQEKQYRQILSRFLIDLSVRLVGRRRFDEAEAHARHAVDVLDAKDPNDRTALALAKFRLGRVMHARGDDAAASEQIAKAVATQRSLDGGSPGRLAWFLEFLGNALARDGQNEDAHAAFEESLALRLQHRAVPYDLGMSYFRVGAVREKLGRIDEAESDFRQAVAHLRDNLPDEHVDTNRAVDHLVGLLRRQSREEAAEEALAEHRAARTERFGVEFGSNWCIAVYKLTKPTAADDAQFLSRSIQGEPSHSFQAPAIDFRWMADAPHPNFPADGFALVAESELQLASGRYEVCLDPALPTRVLINDQVVLNRLRDPAIRTGRIDVSAAEKPLRIRVEVVEPDAATRLRFWLLPMDESSAAHE
ncbi:MAG: protein kinase [Pirellulales bacterium]